MRRANRAALLAGLAALVALAAVGLLLSPQGRAIRLPDIDSDLGAVRLVAKTSILSLCAQQMPCMTQRPSPTVHIYTVWLMVPRPQGQAPEVVKLFTITRNQLGR